MCDYPCWDHVTPERQSDRLALRSGAPELACGRDCVAAVEGDVAMSRRGASTMLAAGRTEVTASSVASRYATWKGATP